MQPILKVAKNDEKKKPMIIKLYDFTKGKTDVEDQKMGKSEAKVCEMNGVR